MNINDFIDNRKSVFIATRSVDIHNIQEMLSNVKVNVNGNILYNEYDGEINYSSLDDIQLAFDSDWKDWVLMCPEFTDFSEEEQEEIEGIIIHNCPVNIWDLYNGGV